MKIIIFFDIQKNIQKAAIFFLGSTRVSLSIQAVQPINTNSLATRSAITVNLSDNIRPVRLMRPAQIPSGIVVYDFICFGITDRQHDTLRNMVDTHTVWKISSFIQNKPQSKVLKHKIFLQPITHKKDSNIWANY